MKLTKDQKADLKVLLEMSKSIGVTLVSDPSTGLTFGWYRNFPNSKMITVATSYFDIEEFDKFRTKTGVYFVLQRLFDVDGKGQTMQLPLGDFANASIDCILASKLGF
jgi:hypothetical protein